MDDELKKEIAETLKDFLEASKGIDNKQLKEITHSIVSQSDEISDEEKQELNNMVEKLIQKRAE